MLWISKVTYHLCKSKLINSFEMNVFLWAILCTVSIIYIKNEYFTHLIISCGVNWINKDLLTYITALYGVILSFVWVSWPLIVGSTEYKNLLKKQTNDLYWNNYKALLQYLRSTFFAILLSVIINMGIFFIEDKNCMIYYSFIGFNVYWIIFFFNILGLLFFIRYIFAYFQIEKNANS